MPEFTQTPFLPKGWKIIRGMIFPEGNVSYHIVYVAENVTTLLPGFNAPVESKTGGEGSRM
jgi:hypothetical protein